jgi:multimeric flavodoxin WrbA
LYKEEIKPCVWCFSCRPDKICVLPRDGGHTIAEWIEAADILIVGTPIYWGNMSGPMKTLFDHCVPVFEYIDGVTIRRRQKGKKAVIAAPPSIGAFVSGQG